MFVQYAIYIFFVCFYDLSVGDNSPRDIGDNIIFLQDDVNPNTKIYNAKD